jgi:WD40 repeat protein
MRHSTTKAFALFLVLHALIGCAEETDSLPLIGQDELAFVRGGALTTSSSTGEPLGRYALDSFSWSPGETTTIGQRSAVAPHHPECLPVYSVDLGDVSRLVALGGTTPDTALAWSPNGKLLAIGSYLGEVLVVDGWTGQVISRRRLAESMIKQVAWSPSGDTLYAGEQSPDAFLHALDPQTLRSIWVQRLADEVGSSPAPDKQDLYGVYTLPAASGLEVLPDGHLLVGATHAWNDSSGTRRNLARLLRFDADGSLLAAWPSEGSAPVTLSRFRIDLQGGLIAVSVGGSSKEKVPGDIPRGGVQILDLHQLKPKGSFLPTPLDPYYKSTFIWEALDVDGTSGKVLAGLADGRVFLWDLDGSEEVILQVGTPRLAADVPITTSIGFGFFTDNGFVIATSGTSIPYGSSSTAARPPSAHPAENRLFHYGLDKALLGTWAGPQQLNGLHPGPNDRSLLVGAGSRTSDVREDAYGVLIFPESEAGPLESSPVFCPTEGPIFFELTSSSDGRVAVTERPWIQADGSQSGAYRVTVLR